MPSWLVGLIAIFCMLVVGFIFILIGIMGENITKLRNINVELKGEIKHLQERNEQLEKQIKQLKEQNNELEKELMKYDKRRRKEKKE